MKLLPCPFCGSEPVFPDAADVFGTCYDAGCEGCGVATISLQIIDCFDYPRDHIHDSWDESEMRYSLEVVSEARRQAIEEWNTRAEPTEAMIEDIKLLLLFAPKDCPGGLDATFYHTLTYDGDRKLQDRIDSIRAMIAAQEREDG